MDQTANTSTPVDAFRLSDAVTITKTIANQITTTTVISSLNPSTFGQSVTLTATVNSTMATGTVTFTIDGTAGTPVAIYGGIASITTSSLSAGSHTITAQYSGDTNSTQIITTKCKYYAIIA